MSAEDEVEVLFETSAADVGCSAGFELLHRYVDEELAGGTPDVVFPGVAAHLRTCPACREDYLGLRDAGQTYGDAGPDLP